MTTCSLLTILSGVFFLYNTSKKAQLYRSLAIEKWVQTNLKISKIIGVICLIISLTIAIANFGRTSGILFWTVSLMTILGLMVIILPLKKLSYKHVSILFTILFILELTF